jgi:hypothetical protein
MRRTLFFAAGSDPKRARGFSRLGWMREVVLGPVAAPSEISYFGVLTSSPEESLEHARKSAGDSGRSVFSVANGRHAAGRSRSAVAHFEYASDAAWSDQGLIDKAQSSFQGGVHWRETSWPNYSTAAPPTFLHQIATLFNERAPRASVRYVYNEQQYLLELTAHRPGRGDEKLVRVAGKVRNLRTRSETTFRVWLEDVSGSILPARIEFQPRSFLKLTFTAVLV